MSDCNGTKWHSVRPNSTFVAMVRLQKTDGTYALAPDVQSVTFKLYDVTDDEPVQVGVTETPTKADIVRTALDTSTIWTKAKDSIGFSASTKKLVTTVGRRYRLHGLFVMTNGDQQDVTWPLKCVE